MFFIEVRQFIINAKGSFRKSRLSAGVLLLIFAQVFTVLIPVSLGLLVDIISADSTYYTLSYYVLLFIFLRLTAPLLKELSEYFLMSESEYWMSVSRKNTFSTIIGTDYSVLNKRSIGELSNLWERGTSSILSIIESLFYHFMPGIFMLIAIVFVLILNYHIIFFIIFLMISVLYFLWLMYSTKQIVLKQNISVEKENYFNAFHVDIFRCIKVVKSAEAGPNYTSKMTRVAKEVAVANSNLIKQQTIWESGNAVIVTIIVLSFIMTYLSGITHDVTAGNFVALIGLAAFLMKPVTDITGAIETIIEEREKARDLVNLLEENSSDTTNETICKKTDWDCVTVNIEEVKYGEKLLLKSTALKIPNGLSLGLSGPSGSGKSTIAECLSNLREVSGVNILGSDGVKIKCVSQTTETLSSTIDENIRLLNKIKDDYLQSIIQCCLIDQIISEKFSGINEFVGNEGSKLSMGEKQRISIARMLLTNPDIIIIDEATSGIELDKEHSIINNIKKMGITVVLITHRLQTMELMDIWYEIKDKKIIKAGASINS